MLKTPKKLFTITSVASGGSGAINSKFEAQNKTKKQKESDGKDYCDCESEGRGR